MRLYSFHLPVGCQARRAKHKENRTMDYVRTIGEQREFSVGVTLKTRAAVREKAQRTRACDQRVVLTR